MDRPAADKTSVPASSIAHPPNRHHGQPRISLDRPRKNRFGKGSWALPWGVVLLAHLAQTVFRRLESRRANVIKPSVSFMMEQGKTLMVLPFTGRGFLSEPFPAGLRKEDRRPQEA